MATPVVSPTPTATGAVGILEAGAGRGQGTQGISLSVFFASLVSSIVIFAVEFGVFLLIKNKFSRI